MRKAKREEWKIAVVESLIKGTDNVVRGAKVRVIFKGRPMRISRPVQKLYPLEVKCAIQGNGQIGQTGNRRFERGRTTPLRRNPSRSAALDARWKSKHMLDSSSQGGGGGWGESVGKEALMCLT